MSSYIATAGGRRHRRRRTLAAAIAAFLLLMLALASGVRAQILFVDNYPYCGATACWEDRGLWAMNDDGSDPHPWLKQTQVPAGESGLSNPSISPDGQTVVFDGSWPPWDAIWSIGAYKWQGGQLTRLSPAPYHDPNLTTGDIDTLHAESPEVAADGTFVYERRWTNLGTITGSHAQVWRQSLGDVGGQGENLNVCVANQLANGIGSPSPNPVAPSLIVYGGCYEEKGNLNQISFIQLLDLGSKTDTPIIKDDPDAYKLYDPSWSPDGNSIVFAREQGAGFGGVHELYVATRSGSAWAVRLLYTGQNQLSTPRFVGMDRIVFTESNSMPDGNPCSDCGLGIWGIPASLNGGTEVDATILAQTQNGDVMEPAWTGITLPRMALPSSAGPAPSGPAPGPAPGPALGPSPSQGVEAAKFTLPKGARAKAARASRSGSFTVPGVRLACLAGGKACSVSATATITVPTSFKASAKEKKKTKTLTLATRKFSMAAGKSSGVKLKLSKRGLSALRRLRQAKVTVTITVSKAGAKTARRSVTMTLKAPVR